MTYLRIGRAGALLSALIMSAASSQAMAEAQWIDGKPVFDSEIGPRGGQFSQEEYDARRRQSHALYPEFMDGGPRPSIIGEAPPVVSLRQSEPAGTIIIDSRGRRLFYVLPGNQAYEYPISVGREGFSWFGTEKISRIADWPDWHPPAEMRERERGLPKIMYGGLKNPLGARALYLGTTLYRIHGTNDPRSIGLAASSGCFRMMNQHVTHLASLAGVGTPVRVVKQYGGVPLAAR